MSAPNAIQVEDLSLSYDGSQTVLSAINLTVSQGEFVCLVGPSGCGKTTLLKRVLSEDHGHKIAIIENEFGEENIDNDILVSDTKEHIVQMSNGCVCCTIREDLRTTLQDLAEKKRKGELDFERVVIETTGLADPGHVAQTFFMDDEIAESFLLDAVLTLVDAKHAAQTLNDRQEERRQDRKSVV